MWVSLSRVLVVCLLHGAANAQVDEFLERARELHAKYPLVDGHNDISLRYRANSYQMDSIDLNDDLTGIAHTDITRLREGGWGGLFLGAVANCDRSDQDAVRGMLEAIDAVYYIMDKYSDTFEFVTTADQLEDAFGRGKIPTLIGLESAHGIDSSMATLRMFHRMGARYLQLTHNCSPPWADAHDQPIVVGGLSEFGEAIVREMNRIGMIICLSHSAPITMHNALNVSVAPIMFSHSNPIGLNSTHSRNVPDDVLLRLRDNGGVMMINYVDRFLVDETVRRSTLEDVFDHIDYSIRLAGEDHVGIGSDYDGTAILPIGLEDVSKQPYLTAELLRRGYTEETVIKIMGGNIIRVMREVERVAEDLQAAGIPQSDEYLDLTTQCRRPPGPSPDADKAHYFEE